MNDLVVINKTVIEQEIDTYKNISQKAFETKQFDISQICIERMNLLKGVLLHSKPLFPIIDGLTDDLNDLFDRQTGFYAIDKDIKEQFINNLKIEI